MNTDITVLLSFSAGLILGACLGAGALPGPLVPSDRETDLAAIEKATSHVETERTEISLYRPSDLVASKGGETSEVLSKASGRASEATQYVESTSISQGASTFVPAPVSDDFEYTFRTEKGIAVAGFKRVAGMDGLATYDLRFKTFYASADAGSAMLTKMSSSLEPDRWEAIEIEDLETVDLSKPYKPIQFHLSMGVGTQISPTKVGIGAFASVEWWDPIPELTIAAPKIGFDDAGFRVGIDVVSWNVHRVVRPLSDTWLAVGTSIPLTLPAQPAIDLSVKTRF